MATKSKKMANRGKNINEILDPNNAPVHARREALRRTLLARKLCTSRCTTPQEMADRFEQLFTLAFNERLRPYCRNARTLLSAGIEKIFGVLNMSNYTKVRDIPTSLKMLRI